MYDEYNINKRMVRNKVKEKSWRMIINAYGLN